MRLLCPHCGKAHLVREGALGSAGRTVRCSSCKSTWFADANGEARTPAHAYEGTDPHALIEQVRKAAAYTPVKTRKAAVQAKARTFAEPGVAIMGVLALFLCSGLVFRESVVRAVPNLASLYKGIGLPVNLRGLEFSEVKSSRDVQGNDQVLTVEGRINNISGGEIAVPLVRVSLRSPTGSEIEAATAKPELVKLDKTGETGFRARFTNPSPDARDALVLFSDSQNLGS